MESPGSLTFEVQDVPGICAVAKARGIVTLLDNTWATPLFFPALGARRRPLDPRLHQICRRPCRRDARLGHRRPSTLGSARPDRRGSRPVGQPGRRLARRARPADARRAPAPPRGQRAQGRALAAGPAAGRRRAPPGAPDCPGHEYWKRDFTGLVGPVLLRPQGRRRGRAPTRFVESLELFGIGYSWGGFESLALPVRPEGLHRVERDPPAPLVRLHIGLEDPDDLIADLDRAFQAIA